MLSRSITKSQHETHLAFNVSVFFLVSIGLLMFVSNGLAVWAVCAAAIHEAAHLLTIYALGYGIGRVSLNMGGAQIVLKGEPVYAHRFLILISGCAGNALAAISAVCLGAESLRGYIFIAANIVLCILNLLPHSSLDGGKLLKLLLCRSEFCDTVCAVCDIAVLMLLMAFGIAVFFIGNKNPTALLLGICFLVKLPFFCKK